MGERRFADLLLVNARVITLTHGRPEAEAIAAAAGRILAIGTLAELRPRIGPDTEIVDAGGGTAVPAFHDAHMHLLSFARAESRVDCRGSRSIRELLALLAARATTLPPDAWIRAYGYDERLLADGRHPHRHDLDGAVPAQPVRLQHRTLHLDVLNTAGLQKAHLTDVIAPAVERDRLTGEPTGRLFHSGDLLRGRMAHAARDELADDVRRVTERLLSWGVTSIQDASVTNGPEEWALFQALAATGHLRVRTFVMPGARHWRDVVACSSGSRLVRPGPVKVMIDEGISDPADVRSTVRAIHAAGWPVALHAVNEAELAIALDALLSTPPAPRWGVDRIEHGAVIPEDALPELRATGAMVVGQPALVYERGDVYRTEFPSALYGWLHRARSLLAAGIPYAMGSDAPVTNPHPMVGLFAARRRLTRGGASLGPGEALDSAQACAALTRAPAQAVGVASELGRLAPGALADIAVLDPESLDPFSDAPTCRTARLTIIEGRVAWRRR